MLCPKCFHKTKVIDSKKTSDAVYRARQCLNCGYKTYTTEVETKTSFTDFQMAKYDIYRERYVRIKENKE